MNSIRVLLAEDHRLVRAGLRSLLDSLPDVEVVGEAAGGNEAIALSAELAPDIILMDIAMKDMTGLAALEMIRKTQETARVIMLSMYSNEEHVIRALELGALGYVLKDEAPGELELAIHAAMRNQRWYSQRLPRYLIESYQTRSAASAEDIQLTPRQLDVLKRISEGASTKEIAYELGISVKTVETFRAQIMHRLGIDDVAGLVRYALRRGISVL